jgi:hypothetical protein
MPREKRFIEWAILLVLIVISIQLFALLQGQTKLYDDLDYAWTEMNPVKCGDVAHPCYVAARP